MIEIPEELPPLVKRWEGFHRVVTLKPVPTAVPYICPAGYWTIGYGELCQKDHEPITEPAAAWRLKKVLLPSYIAHAVRLSPILMLEEPRRLAAISDFVFNLGPTRYTASTLRKRVNEGRWAAACDELRRWVFGGGRKLPGLVARREAECELLR